MSLYTPTGGSRMAAWFFPAFTVTVALLYLLQPLERTHSPAFDFADSLMPLRAWGLVFLLVATAKAVGLGLGRVTLYALAMALAAGLYFAWAVFFAASAIASPEVSLTAPLWPLFVAYFHVAMVATVTGH